MKKKLSIIVLAVVLIFGIVGCSNSSDSTEVNDAELTGYVQTLIGSFSQMSETDFIAFQEMSDLELNLTLLNSGLPIEADNFLSMIDAWEAGIEECGSINEAGEFQVEKSGKEILISTNLECTQRDAQIIITFDEKLNMDSMTINAHYSMGEILQKAVMNTVLGMGTVFVVLIFISFIISLFKYIPILEAKIKGAKKSNTKEAVPASEAALPEGEALQTEEDTQLVAVITAAIAAMEGTTTDRFVVRSIKRRKSNKWN